MPEMIVVETIVETNLNDVVATDSVVVAADSVVVAADVAADSVVVAADSVVATDSVATGKKQVDFLASIESKALIETIAPVMDNFDIENIMDVLPQIIKHVQHYKNLNGTQKKDMIVAMLKHLIDITDGPGNDDIWDPIIKRLIPSIVNTLVKVDQGKLKLNTKAPCLRLFSCCLPKI
jgi:hypothetical protein